MKITSLLIVLSAVMIVAGCGEPDPNAPGSDAPIQNPPVDTDPTPQTGRGGESQVKSPDGTTTGGPATSDQAPNTNP